MCQLSDSASNPHSVAKRNMYSFLCFPSAKQISSPLPRVWRERENFRGGRMGGQELQRALELTSIQSVSGIKLTTMHY